LISDLRGKPFGLASLFLEHPGNNLAGRALMLAGEV
jgi:hypothetical protein